MYCMLTVLSDISSVVTLINTNSCLCLGIVSLKGSSSMFSYQFYKTKRCSTSIAGFDMSLNQTNATIKKKTKFVTIFIRIFQTLMP